MTTLRRSAAGYASGPIEHTGPLASLDPHHIPVELIRFLLDTIVRSGADGTRITGWPPFAREMGPDGAAAWPRTTVAAAYKNAMMRLQNHVCDLEGKVPISYDEFDMLCYCIISCGTLRDAIQRAQRFFAMLETRKVSIELREEGHYAGFSMHTHRPRNTPATFLLDLSGLAYFYQLFSWLVAEPLPLRATSMAYEKPLASPAIVVSIFGHPIQFDRSANKLLFPIRFLDRPVTRNARELADRLGEVSFDIMPSEWAAARLSDQLAALFRAALARDAPLPKLSDAARLLNQSEATLRRRLAEENMSARALKEACLFEASAAYLQDGATSIEDISARLGFSSPGSFRRTFKRWTGQSPSDYRAGLMASRDMSR